MTRRILIIFAVTFTTFSGLLFILVKVKQGSLSIYDLGGSFFVCGAVIVGSLIIDRKPENLFGWLFFSIGFLWAGSGSLQAYVNYILQSSESTHALLSWLAMISSWLTAGIWMISSTFLFLLFPDGHLPSRRWRFVGWLTGISILIALVVDLIKPGPLSEHPTISNPLGIARFDWLPALTNWVDFIIVPCVFICITSVLVRYYSAVPMIKRQIKWIAHLGVVLAFVFISSELIRSQFGESSFLLKMFELISALVFAAFPLVIGIAVLRYNLMDIDLIIRRTLTYAILTATLGLIYFGTVVMLQTAVRQVTNEQSPLVIILSTLLIAALFTPLRHRIQNIIDRRFYRRKYDSVQILAHFAQAARDEVDLDCLTSAILKVVEDTLQPETMSFWLSREKESGKIHFRNV